MSSKWEQFRVVLALALAVARIQDGCSGYACFRPWLLPAILRSTWLLATLGSVVAGTRDSCSGYACFRPCLLSMGPPRPANTKTRVGRSIYARFCVIPRFWPRWALWIWDSCSGYAGFRPRLLAAEPPCQGNAKTRVDRQSMRVFAFWPRARRAEWCQCTLERPQRAESAGPTRRHDTSAYPLGWSSEPRPSSRAKARFSPAAPFTGLGLAFFPAWRKQVITRSV